MCGIVGGLFPVDSIQSALDTLHHRGPDDRGMAILRVHGNDIVFGQTRLAIIDLSAGGHQPMYSSDDGRYVLVFNGEIYNYPELREELAAYGHRFRSDSDTEVLLAGYQQWGRDVLHKVSGMFAFAIVDIANGTLFLARDPFGIKPLFYTLGAGRFAFCSEIPPLIGLPDVGRQVNAQKIYDYLLLGLCDTGERTFFAEILQLPAAHFLELDIASLEIKACCCYWRPDLTRQLDIGFEAAAGKLKELFLKSVALHLRSDVPVGAALSGGIDSSAIVCAIRHLNPNAELHTFTFVAEDDRISEEKWADLVGRHVGAVMHKVSASSSELAADLDDLVRAQGEPFGSTSIYAQYKVFQKAKEVGIKVMLDGQGADELFGGYPGHSAARLASLWRSGLWRESWEFLRNASDWPGRDRNRMLMQALKHFVPTAILPLARTLVGQGIRASGLNKNWLISQGVCFKEIDKKNSEKDYLRRELAKSLEITSIPALLRYEDRNSMAHSIESRVPFLNVELVDFIYSLPESYLIDRHGTSKSIFRQAMRGLVPDEILDRRDKIGFETPEKRWLVEMKDWVESTLDNAQRTPLLDYSVIRQGWDDVLNGQRVFDLQIWRWLNFIKWIEVYGINDAPH